LFKRSSKLGHYFLKGIKPVIRLLIISDTVIIGAAGLLGPILRFLLRILLSGGNAAVAGLAAGIYLFTKSILQIPIANFIDKVRGEKDDFRLMFICTILIALIPLLYLVIDTPLQLYFVQFILGSFTAFTFPTYLYGNIYSAY
jgi:hypothetical protein